MRRPALLVVGTGLALGLALWARGVEARQVNRVSPLLDLPPLPGFEEMPPELPPQAPVAPVDPDTAAANLEAGLTAIRRFESSTGPRGFVMLYGGGELESFADHPGNLGWQGVRLPDEWCRRAGYNPPCYSTAAGAWQITRTTWNKLRRRIPELLPDFSPESQRAAAVQLIADTPGALALLQAGQLDEALQLLRGIWSSIPGAGRGQPEGPLSAWRQAFADAGGQLA